MIIYLEASTQELLESPLHEIEELFSELIRSSLRGYHLILIDRQACDWALANLKLNSREQAHLYTLKGIFTQKGSLRQIARCVLHIGVGSFGLQKLGSNYQIGHIPLLRGDYLDKSILLVENEENDGEFARQVFHALRRDHAVKNFTFETRHGGGSTIVSVFDAHLRSKRILVCLADSDRYAPCGPVSSTVNALVKTASLQTFVGELFITLCREVENHIPNELIQLHKICPEYKDFDLLRKLINMQAKTSPIENIWFWFDAKHGFFGGEVLRKKHSSSVESWICQNFGQDNDISSVSISGFGEALLQQFLKSGEAMRDFATYVQSDAWKAAFGNFFEDIMWYFAADQKRAVA